MEVFGQTSNGSTIHQVTIKPILSKQLEFDPDFSAWKNVRAKLITYGATITELWVVGYSNKTRDPRFSCIASDIILGYPNIYSYENNAPHHGATVGRVAGRISASQFAIPFEINASISAVYKVTSNLNREHCLHGGIVGLSYRKWEIVNLNSSSVTMKVETLDGEDGFPGDLTVFVTYSICVEENLTTELSIDYFASITGAICPINLTNHAYFNLAGHNAGPEALSRHVFQLHSEKLCEVDEQLMPTGRMKIVCNKDGTDLRKPVCINERLLGNADVKEPSQGFDDFYVFMPLPENLPNVVVSEPHSGRILEMYTDQLGVQFYTGNCLDPVSDAKGKDECAYVKHGGFCLEAQGYPNAVNTSNFPKQFVIPNLKNYTQRTVYAFSLADN